MKSVFRAAALAVAVVALSEGAFAQFSQQTGVLAGPTVWTEGVVAADLDNDDDLDIVFANGNGFSSAGPKLRPTIVINNGVAGGNPVFADETNTRIPNFTQNAKGVIAFDMERDGDLDLFFANAFGQPQRLLRNDGGGFFSDVTASQFTTANMNSFGACAFDKDNDGDLDLAVCDNTGSSLFSTGRMRLFENDSNGFFTEVTNTSLPPNTKSSQQNVTAVDVDNDMDLDLILDGRSTPQFLYVNDGTGNFTLQNVLPPGSSNVYETDWADLDGDGDIDGFYISLSGFSEGTARNNLVPSGNLTFTGSTGTISGTNTGDDNEVAFVDWDNDGDLDPVVGALGQQREKLYNNNGNFTFTFTTAFSAQSDSTLDMTFGDFDNDGDYDAVTAQGESGNFLNRYYRNDGPADTTAPVFVLADDNGPLASSAPFVVRARVTDSTMDDGEQFVDCTLNYTVTLPAGAPINGSVAMDYSGGSIYRGEIDAGLSADLLLGSTVSYSMSATDYAGNTAVSASESFVACGGVEYGPGTGANILSLSLGNVPTPGGTAQISLSGGQPNAPGVFLLGVQATSVAALGGTLLVVPVISVDIAVGPGGALNLNAPIANDPTLIGDVFRIQAILADGTQTFGAAFSNGLAVSLCE